MILTDDERKTLEHFVTAAERQTKAQIVLATVRRSDSYAEIPWKAFALGTSLAAFPVLLFGVILPVWISGMTILFVVVAILAFGGFISLLSVISEGFARLFLSRYRAETEIRQYAESMFLDRELFSTQGRNGILLLVSQFERKVFILPDKGVSDRLTAEIIQEIIKVMAEPLKRGELKRAMETGLNKLVEEISQGKENTYIKDELPNQIIEEEGV